MSIAYHVGYLQCSSDISELCIRVSYERILRIRICQYAHIYEFIRTHIRVYTRVYVSLLCIPISFFMWSIVSQTKNIIFLGKENASKRNLHIVKTSCRSVKAIIFRVFNHLVNSFCSNDVSERNSMAITFNIHTKSHTVRGRPTLNLLERFGNVLIRELYERLIYEQSFTNEPSIEKCQAKPRTCTCKHNCVFRCDRETSRIPEATLKRLKRG